MSGTGVSTETQGENGSAITLQRKSCQDNLSPDKEPAVFVDAIVSEMHKEVVMVSGSLLVRYSGKAPQPLPEQVDP